MATNQKIKPCECGNADLDVFKYDNGWCHVECLKCNYLGPGEGSIRQAIISHNKQRAASNSLAVSNGSIAP